MGCEAIYRGFVDGGLEVLRGVYHCAWEKNRSPWDQGLAHRAPGGRPSGLRTYMTCPTTWHVLNALSGVTLDVPSKTLYISPRVPSETQELHIPVFLGTFWAWVDFVPARGVLSLRIVKAFADGEHEFTQVARDGNGPYMPLEAPFRTSPGAVLDLSQRLSALAPFANSRRVEWEVEPAPVKRPGLDPAGWRLEAHVQGKGTIGTKALAVVLDNDPGTRWSTGRPMQPGDWFQVDLGAQRRIKGVWADMGEAPNDYARGYEATVSLDGEDWRTVASGHEEASRGLVQDAVWRVQFEPVEARFVRIAQTGSDQRSWWSVCELYVLGEDTETKAGGAK